MARAAPEHKKITDAFDAVITFAYLYEWEMRRSEEINKLMALYRSVAEHMKKTSESKLIYFNAFQMHLLEIEVVDGLYFAAKHDQVLDVSTDDWIGRHDVSTITKSELLALHQEHFLEYLNLVTLTFNNLRHSFPVEVQPYLTERQVLVLLESQYTKVKNAVAAPVQKKLLAAMIHQLFLWSFGDMKDNDNSVPIFNNLIYDYWEKAEKDREILIKKKFIVETVKKFIFQAKDIKLHMDDYYSWSTICIFPLRHEDLLSMYARANRYRIINDALYHGERKSCDSAWRESLRGKMITDTFKYRPHHFSHDKEESYIFDSKRNNITIDHRQLQNCAALVIHYDSAIFDLNDKLFSYSRHLSLLIDGYIEDHYRIFQVRNLENGARAYKDWDNYKRCTITNAGSILQNLCALIYLQLDRSGSNAKNAHKRICGDIHDLFNENGFKYSEETINSVRKRAKKNAEHVASELLGTEIVAQSSS